MKYEVIFRDGERIEFNESDIRSAMKRADAIAKQRKNAAGNDFLLINEMGFTVYEYHYTLIKSR